jgi:hypothetical protein
MRDGSSQNDPKSKALCVNAERLEGSPPPELPNYGLNLPPNPAASKYIFRNEKVICGNQVVMTYLPQNNEIRRV